MQAQPPPAEPFARLFAIRQREARSRVSGQPRANLHVEESVTIGAKSLMNQQLSALLNHCPSRAQGGTSANRFAEPRAYDRMFPELPPFQGDEPFLHMLGGQGGPCHCEDLDDSPASLAETAAGWPIFGQLIAHDITADRSILRTHANTADLRNGRNPRLDLECLYGDGPIGHPFLYQRQDAAKFLLGQNHTDLPRNREGVALIGDPRNDSHILMSQLHLSLLKAHNTFVDEVRLAGMTSGRVFEEAARELRWHYQWITIYEFLPGLVGHTLVDQVLREGLQWFTPNPAACIPLEFVAAAYRYGHSQIRHRYRVNAETDPVPLFPDLLGFRAVPPRLAVDWTLFFDADGATTAQRARKIDGKLVQSLIELPITVAGECNLEVHRSLAVRDLQRGYGVGLPSGEAVARHLGVAPLTSEQVGLGSAGGETPLWYYILREAEVCTGGHGLGPVGGRIVTEVLVGLIDSDPASFRRDRRDWQPYKTLMDLLTA